MGEVATERMEQITAATLKHAAIKAELKEMRHLAWWSRRSYFLTCEEAFSRRAVWLEGQEQRALDEIVALCTSGLEGADICRKAIEEITAGSHK